MLLLILTPGRFSWTLSLVIVPSLPILPVAGMEMPETPLPLEVEVDVEVELSGARAGESFRCGRLAFSSAITLLSDLNRFRFLSSTSLFSSSACSRSASPGDSSKNYHTKCWGGDVLFGMSIEGSENVVVVNEIGHLGTIRTRTGVELLLCYSTRYIKQL